jgi:hypothetical protein
LKREILEDTERDGKDQNKARNRLRPSPWNNLKETDRYEFCAYKIRI